MSVLAFVRAATGDPLPDVNEIKQTLTDYSNAVVEITGQSHAITHTVFIPIDPDDRIVKAVDENLKRLQAQAQKWTDVTAPALTQVPQAIINFDNTFEAQHDTIAELLTQIGERLPNAQEQADLVELMEALRDELLIQQTIIRGALETIVDYQGALERDHASLTKGANSIAELIKEDKDAVIALNEDIQKLREAIEKLRHPPKPQLNWGKALKMLVLLLDIELGGETEFELARNITFSGGDMVEFLQERNTAARKSIAADQASIVLDQSKISDENRQIVQLNGIVASINELVEANRKAGTTGLAVLASWQGCIDQMELIISYLKDNTESVLDSITLEAARYAWGQLKELAVTMQFTLSDISVEVSAIPSANA